MTALYSVTTYDIELGEFTPQDGLRNPSQGIPLWRIRPVLRELREHFGYEGKRGDPSVRVERIVA